MRLSILMPGADCHGNAIAWETHTNTGHACRRTTNSYDPATGNMTNTYRHADGSSDTYGINPRTGSQWNSRSDRRGNQSGTDADGNIMELQPRYQYLFQPRNGRNVLAAVMRGCAS